MRKTISISIRVSEEELNRLKEASVQLNYASYSEFIRRTALIEAERVLGEKSIKNRNSRNGGQISE